MFRNYLTGLAAAIVLLFPAGGAAFAANPGTQGQPNQNRRAA